MLKRCVGFIAVLALTALVVAGCGGGSNNSSTTDGGTTDTTDGGTTDGGTTGTSIQLPRTGQIIGYNLLDDGALQKGVAWPDPRFIDIGDGAVADALNGLIWAKDASTPTVVSCGGGAKTWQGALDYVACLNSTVYLGYNDWILPNINELKSLIHIQNVLPNLSIGYPFTGVQSGGYWSSSSYANDTGSAWAVGMNGGSVGFGSKTSGNTYVWPIRAAKWSYSALALPNTGQTISYASGDDGARQRGVPAPNIRFTTNGDGTVTDKRTGLIWLQNANCWGFKTWSWSFNSVVALANGSCGLSDGSVAGDWRLPNREELASLVDRSMYGPALSDGHPFINVQSGFYWSSSTYASDAGGSAWGASVNVGHEYINNKVSYYYVWPVRGE